jgi:hypothetical protein
LSRDPVGERGGINTYVILENHPVGAIDALGMYEVDVHRYLTRFLAEKAGFCPSRADSVGRETQALDDPGSTRDAMSGGRNLPNMRDFHFVSQTRLAELRRKAVEACGCKCDKPDWKLIGEYLHALEDTYSHSTGTGDRNWEYYNGPIAAKGKIPEVKIPEIPAILPGGATVGGQAYDLGYDIGHGALGHTPDWTWRDPKKAMKMAEMLFNELGTLAKDCGGGCPAVGWDNVRPAIEKFVKFVPDLYTQWIRIKGAPIPVPNATFEGYNEKIQLLDPTYNLDPLYKQVFKCKK